MQINIIGTLIPK